MTIRPSSRSNGTGPARGDSRAGVTEVSGRRPGAGSSASEQTGEGAAPTRRRRAVRYDRQRPGHQQGADSATPRRKARGLFTGAEEPVGDPWDRVATPFRVPGGTGRRPAGRSGRLRQTAAPPQHTTPQPQSAAPQPSQSFSVSAGRRKVSGREGRARGAVRVGARRASRVPRGPRGPRGGRGASGTSDEEILERSKRSRGDLRKTL